MEELENELTELKQELEVLEHDRDTFEVDESDHTQSYDDMLDECFEGLFNLTPSYILCECDPIQYNCGLSDYVDSLSLSYETEHPEESERIDELNELIEEKEEELQELQEEDEDE